MPVKRKVNLEFSTCFSLLLPLLMYMYCMCEIKDDKKGEWNVLCCEKQVTGGTDIAARMNGHLTTFTPWPKFFAGGTNSTSCVLSWEYGEIFTDETDSSRFLFFNSFSSLFFFPRLFHRLFSWDKSLSLTRINCPVAMKFSLIECWRISSGHEKAIWFHFR